MDVIVFRKEDKSVGLIRPSSNSLLTIEEIAVKDVPNGLPFRIVDHSTLPDFAFFDAWEWDDNDEQDGVGGGE